MNIKRSWLLWIIGALGIGMILYGVTKQLIGFSVDPALEKTFFDFIIIIALGILIYNRKLVKEETKNTTSHDQPQE